MRPCCPPSALSKSRLYHGGRLWTALRPAARQPRKPRERDPPSGAALPGLDRRGPQALTVVDDLARSQKEIPPLLAVRAVVEIKVAADRVLGRELVDLAPRSQILAEGCVGHAGEEGALQHVRRGERGRQLREPNPVDPPELLLLRGRRLRLRLVERVEVG